MKREDTQNIEGRRAYNISERVSRDLKRMKDTAELALRFKSPLAERLMQEASSPSRRMMRLASPIDFDPGVRAVLAA